MRTRLLPLLLVIFLPLVACPGDTEYDRVNESSDCFEVVITPAGGDDDDSAGDEERGVPSGGDDDDSSAGDDDDSSAGDDDDSSAGDDDDSSAGDDDDSSAGDDDDVTNDDDDSAGDDDDAAEAQSIDLHARPGFFDQDVIGTASLTPGGGAAGTRFDLAVVLEDTGTEQGNPVTVVQRVSVLVDNGEVTLNEFDLSESPADERRFVITLQAGGDPAQSRRTDELCVALYTEI